MFRFFFTCLIIEFVFIDVSSLYCYVCSNCAQTSNYTLTSEYVGSTKNLSCYKIISQSSDTSEIIIRGYTSATCSEKQITLIWGYQQGFCCSTDLCNSTRKINGSILFLLMILFLNLSRSM